MALSSREEVSFWFGMASLVSWGVAEIPQIVTNFRTKSGHGVSFLFLLTWVLGDVFNVVGCALEPATLPTQLYTATLYTAITLILLVQTLYYEYPKKLRKTEFVNPNQQVEEDKKTTQSQQKTAPIPLAANVSRRDICYTSARSLTNSGTPTFGSYLGASGTCAPLLDAESPPPRRSTLSSFSPGRGALLGICASLSLPGKSLTEAAQVLQLPNIALENTPISFGVVLGWMMAFIYMGGRLPQIILNIRRGSIEGLSPSMFVLAVLGNSTYVTSILVDSVEWRRLKANAPWLLDAAVCVLLDLFILLQFIYYKWIHGGKKQLPKDNFGDYEEIKKITTE